MGPSTFHIIGSSRSLLTKLANKYSHVRRNYFFMNYIYSKCGGLNDIGKKYLPKNIKIPWDSIYELISSTLKTLGNIPKYSIHVVSIEAKSKDILKTRLGISRLYSCTTLSNCGSLSGNYTLIADACIPPASIFDLDRKPWRIEDPSRLILSIMLPGPCSRSSMSYSTESLSSCSCVGHTASSRIKVASTSYRIQYQDFSTPILIFLLWEC